MSLPIVYGRLVGALNNKSNRVYVDLPLISNSPVKTQIARTFSIPLQSGLNQLALGVAPNAILKFHVLISFPVDFPLEFVTLKGNSADIGVKVPSKGTTMLFTYDQAGIGAGNFNLHFDLTDDATANPIEVYVF